MLMKNDISRHKNTLTIKVIYTAPLFPIRVTKENTASGPSFKLIPNTIISVDIT